MGGNDELIVIDGYNAIFRAPGLRDQARADLERARAELVRRIGEAFHGRRERVIVVFDGHHEVVSRSARASAGVQVVFSSPPETADQRIQRLVEGARPAGRGGRGGRLAIRIVSSDREVAGRARLWGATAVSVEDFLHEVEERRTGGARDRRPGKQAADRPVTEVDEWERLFRQRSGEAGDREKDDP